MKGDKYSIKSGMVFGRLTITGNIKMIKKGRGFYPYYECVCSCGTKKYIHYYSLLSGSTKSCGCLQKDWMKKTFKIHNMAKNRIYKIRAGIKERCCNSKNKSYKNYGGRGIKMCDERYNNFENFYNDMGASYENHVKQFGEKDTTIERINNDGNYCKENCKWATKSEQGKNKRRAKGKWERLYGLSEREIAERCGISYGSLRYQLRDKYDYNMELILKKYNCSIEKLSL